MNIDEVQPPSGSLIAPFVGAEGHYWDAFRIERVETTLPAFVSAFYGSPLFRAELLVLRLARGTRASAADVTALAQGESERFAVWGVEARDAGDILLGDESGRTKSWLSVRDGHLWFGSVVVPVERRGKLVLGPVFDSLIGAHKAYSRALLAAAYRRL